MNRRGFLRGLMAFAAVAATPVVPVLALDNRVLPGDGIEWVGAWQRLRNPHDFGDLLRCMARKGDKYKYVCLAVTDGDAFFHDLSYRRMVERDAMDHLRRAYRDDEFVGPRRLVARYLDEDDLEDEVADYIDMEA